MVPSPFTTSEEAKSYSAEHLRYEILMLFYASQHFPYQADQAIKNVLIESFGIHLRTILDFLYAPAKQTPGDVYAYHYTSDPNHWNPSPMSKALTKARNRVNKEIGHLTKQRVAGFSPEKNWHSDILNELVPILNQFVSSADPTKLDESVIHLVEKLSA